ncbi:hypothetical protein [Phaeovulum vinaykumarii]|uniref:hypothetical protein n=1 Tax=Phaeovulum vinaykumarii TaxID=407234 RepID=UPI00135643F8|nr:hypothetical protein [Phaeovulum vinaykumarii]
MFRVEVNDKQITAARDGLEGTNPANMENALETNFEFWIDNDTELNERVNAWLVN